MITPKTHKVHTIWLSADLDNSTKAAEEVKIVKGILKQRFTIKDEGFQTLNFSNGFILAACRSEIFGFGKSMSIPIDA